MKKLVLIFIPALICGVVFVSCDSNDDFADWTNKIEELREHNEKKVRITEGIWGTIVKREGNCMPGASNSCKYFPVKREVLIYEYTTFNEVEQADFYSTFYTKIATKLVARTTADKEGFFEFRLKPGKYSVFVIENRLFYANSFDGQGGIFPVTVELSKVSEHIFEMNYGSSS